MTDGSPGDALSQLRAKDERIRALEAVNANLRKYLDEAHSALRNYEARAEKAEAGVRELETVLLGIHRHVALCHDSSDSNLDDFYAYRAKLREARPNTFGGPNRNETKGV